MVGGVGVEGKQMRMKAKTQGLTTDENQGLFSEDYRTSLDLIGNSSRQLKKQTFVFSTRALAIS